MDPLTTVAAFDAFLAQEGQSFAAIVVGGGALSLLGVSDRFTQDLDVLDPELPVAIVGASQRFAAAMRGRGVELADDWLNNGPRALVAELPEGWRARLRRVFEGRGLELDTLGRPDLLKTKLFALCDRGLDRPDCIALQPTADELAAAKGWVAQRDGHPQWPQHVERTLQDLAKRLGHGVP